MILFVLSVKKPDEFNRPSIPKRQRKVKKAKVTLSKKVTVNSMLTFFICFCFVCIF